jgi:V/A-type H+/Na+-transporting ATPase subunit I
VTTYGTVPYVDVDPTLFAAAAYVVMFGMMFGDVAHGLAIGLCGIAALAVRWPGVSRLRPVAWFLIATGCSAMIFGLLYGEAFGPTGLVPTVWVRPLDEPETFLVVGLLVGVVLLAGAFAISIVNRWREGGAALAIYDASGIAGALLLLGVAAALAASGTGSSGWWWVCLGCIVSGVVLVFAGLAGRSSRAGASSGVSEAVVEMFDVVLRLGSNVVSFTRLAAFGLTHAVITEVVWVGAAALWARSDPLGVGAGVALFVVGNVAAFALGALVAGVQALRLEYYELFSRLFATSGRPFSPWHVPVERTEDS